MLAFTQHSLHGISWCITVIVEDTNRKFKLISGCLIFAELQDSKTAARYVHMLQLIGPFGFQFLPEKNDGSCDVLGTCPLKEQKLN